MTNEVMKKCPFCAETIKREAIRCRYCGSTLDEQYALLDERKQERAVIVTTYEEWTIRQRQRENRALVNSLRLWILLALLVAFVVSMTAVPLIYYSSYCALWERIAGLCRGNMALLLSGVAIIVSGALLYILFYVKGAKQWASVRQKFQQERLDKQKEFGIHPS